MGIAPDLGAAVSAARRLVAAAAVSLGWSLAAGPAQAELYYLIVGGHGGDPGYEEAFAEAAADMAAAAERTLGTDQRITVLTGDGATREALRAVLADYAANLTAADRIAVFLIGHGSHDGQEYKFNLTGPDINDVEFAELLTAVPARSQLVVNGSSASGAVLESWTADGRALITATRNGRERNATRFAEHWAAALSAADADINKNGSISVQEAFDYAARLVAESYESEGALATEHPEIRGDATGAFEIARLEERVATSAAVASLNQRKTQLEEQIASLRLRREELGDDYLPQLQSLAVELALVQQQIDAEVAEP